MSPAQNPSALATIGFSRWVGLGGRFITVLVGAWMVSRCLGAGEPQPHWAFQPLLETPPPRTENPRWCRNPIDAFILARLEQEHLSPSPEADRNTWLRRVSLDLTGLPPTVEQREAFLQDQSPEARAKVVESLLGSPRYGERWAQHWLDVVRYADTDGFEVNTERPNAWPYRDYVIRAFNEDRPYHRFLREQLAGDQLGEDAATGFLVTAAALLPGQIGQDEPSKRLARQDALSEIVANTGQTLLGLSVGCARCHDHKFDPISTRDYYSWQAFFAGVSYGERPIQSAERTERLRQAELLRPRLAEVQEALSRFEPLASVSEVPRRETSPVRNDERFEPLEARFVRFSIHDANCHPTLGIIEPCLDELEIFSAGADSTNVALASLGTRVTASGSRQSDAHQLEHVHDGHYGNAHSWMSDQIGAGWVQFELARPVRIDRVVWSRDREGMFSDRLATAFTLEAGLTLDSMKRLAAVPPLRPPVNPRRTVDRFAPVTTRKVRFTIDACSFMEPCLDEVETLTAETPARNVALARVGTRLMASGSLTNSPSHRLEHLNDGLYGNDHSWISSELGRGWVELEFPAPERIDRVVWSRDRDGKLSDRMPTVYRIEVLDESGTWKPVAGSGDRKKFDPEDRSLSRGSLALLSPEEQEQARELERERKSLDERIATLSGGPTVFGGVFRDPEVTHILRRGDPEQPTETVMPAVLSALGDRHLTSETPDPDRRMALGEWVADAARPLTARVMVNRIWQAHFGTGLVETANDFGRNGTPPSHPELLDWLARKLILSGWSVKHLQRLIVESATYGQSSHVDPAAQAKDSRVKWLWRFPSRRLEAETLRDSILAVNGRLDFRQGGPGFNLFNSRGGLNGFPPIESFSGDGLRRLVYAHKVRMERDAVFGVFDCPDAGQSAPARRQSTTPIQALNLFNSRFTLEEAAAFAARVQRELGPAASSGDQMRRAYVLALSREPEPDELAALEPVVREQGLPVLCRALYNSNEFLVLP